jgi:hypothetical protein
VTGEDPGGRVVIKAFPKGCRGIMNFFFFIYPLYFCLLFGRFGCESVPDLGNGFPIWNKLKLSRNIAVIAMARVSVRSLDPTTSFSIQFYFEILINVEKLGDSIYHVGLLFPSRGVFIKNGRSAIFRRYVRFSLTIVLNCPGSLQVYPAIGSIERKNFNSGIKHKSSKYRVSI